MAYQIGLSNGQLLHPKKYWQIPDDLTNCVPLKTACETYFYSRSALMRRIKMGRLQGFKIGHRWFVDVSMLQPHHSQSSV